MNNSIHNVSNLGIAHHSPGGIRMTTHSPSSTYVPRPRTLAGQNPPTHQEDHNLRGEPWSNPGNINPPLNRGEPLDKFTPPSPRIYTPTGEIHPSTGRAHLRRDSLRIALQPHALPPKGEPLAEFRPTASHPTHPGGGEMYLPTGRAPRLQESLRRAPHPHTSPLRGEPLEKFGLGNAHPTHPGGGDIYPPTGQATDCREPPRILPHLHASPPRGEPLLKFGPQPTQNISHMGGYLVNFGTHGGLP